MVNSPTSEMLSYRPPESFFLEEKDDYPRASVADKLTQGDYEKRYGLIHKALIPFFTKKAVATGAGFQNGNNGIYGISAQTILEFAQNLKNVGIEPWQVGFDEKWRDDGINPYQITENQTMSQVLDSRITDNQLVRELKEFGYFEGWNNTFPHVNLHHLLVLARKYPDAYFASHNQELEAIPVPGVQFFHFGIGEAVTIQEKQTTNQIDNWETHWGDKYNEKFKQALKRKIIDLDIEGKIGETVLDLGCGANPVSDGLTRPGRRIVLVDNSSKVHRLKHQNRYSVQYNLDRIADERFSNELQGLLGVSPRGIFDSVIISDVLNYIDWKKVLKILIPFMKKGGRLIVNNMPDQGYQKDFSPQRPRDNLEIIQFIQQEMNCHIEEIHDAAQICGRKDASSRISRRGQMVLVAKM